jgi:hypothetical protein
MRRCPVQPSTPQGPDQVNVFLFLFFYFFYPPIFLKEDCEQITRDPVWAEKIPEFMSIAAEVATGNRRRVLEDGPDKPNSDDEDIPDMKPDEETGMYAPGMDPKKGPVMLTPEQVAAQKAAAQAQKGLRVPPRRFSSAEVFSPWRFSGVQLHSETTVSYEWVLDMHHPASGATRRCPVQSSTPLGPDQVNVLLLLLL